LHLQEDSDDEEWEEGFLEAHEELWPLKEALERAVMRKTEAIAQKEALEAKVGVPLWSPLSSPAVACPSYIRREQLLQPRLAAMSRQISGPCSCGATAVAVLPRMVCAAAPAHRLNAILHCVDRSWRRPQAQDVAQLAIGAVEACDKARRKADEAAEELVMAQRARVAFSSPTLHVITKHWKRTTQEGVWSELLM